MIKIGNIELPKFPLLLAPMEDVSDPPFRALCKEQGADVVYTEFISSEGLIRNAAKSTKKLDIYTKERPVGIQIFGSNLDSMLGAVDIVEKTNPDIIDIGMGDVTLTGTQTLTNKTLTSPKIGTSILDTNGNELFKLTATSSAVNEITYNNAATGNKPTLTASGDDTNIGVSIQPKGSGTVTIDALTFPAADGSSGQILQTDGSGTLSFTTPSSGISMGKAIAAAIVFG